MSVEAGWYPDPYDPVLVRWFDGQNWTEHTQANPQHHTPTVPSYTPPPAAAPYPPQPEAYVPPPVSWSPYEQPAAAAPSPPTGTPHPQQQPAQPSPQPQPQPAVVSPYEQPGWAVDTRTGQWDHVNDSGRLTPPDETPMRPVGRTDHARRRRAYLAVGAAVMLLFAGVAVLSPGKSTNPIPAASTATLPPVDTNTWRDPDGRYSFTPLSSWQPDGTHPGTWHTSDLTTVTLTVTVTAADGATLHSAADAVLAQAAQAAGYSLVSNSGITTRTGAARLVVYEEGVAPHAAKPSGQTTTTTVADTFRVRHAVTIVVTADTVLTATFQAPASRYLTEWSSVQAALLTLRVPAGAAPTTTVPAPTSTSPALPGSSTTGG